MTNEVRDAVPRPPGVRRAGIRVAMLGGVYLFLVIAIVTIEVTLGKAPILGWAFLTFSLAYALGVILICFADIKKKHIAFICAVAAILVGLLLAIIVGVNFKFLIGGDL